MFRAFDHIGSCTVVLASFSALLMTSTASAQEDPTLDPVFRCQEVENDAARLACYDSAVGGLRADRNELVVIRRSAVEAVESDSFGLELPSLPRLSLSLFSTRDNQLETGSAQTETTEETTTAQSSPTETVASVLRREDDGQINAISLPIARVERRGYDTVQIHTANGQIWEITDRVGNRPIRVRDDSVMVIRRASLGSYLMQIDGRDRSYRVQRVR